MEEQAKHKYFEVDGMILRDDESEFNIDEFLEMVLKNGYHITGEFKSFDENGE